MDQLAVPLGGLTLKNPLIAGAGEHLIEEAGVISALDAGAAVVVIKSTNEVQAAKDSTKAGGQASGASMRQALLSLPAAPAFIPALSMSGSRKPPGSIARRRRGTPMSRPASSSATSTMRSAWPA